MNSAVNVVDPFVELVTERVLERLAARAPSAPSSFSLAAGLDAAGISKRRGFAAARVGELAARKIGRSWVVTKEDLDAWIRRHGGAPTIPTSTIEDELGLMRAPMRRAR